MNEQCFSVRIQWHTGDAWESDVRKIEAATEGQAIVRALEHFRHLKETTLFASIGGKPELAAAFREDGKLEIIPMPWARLR